MLASDDAHLHLIRVRYADTDQMGVAHHAAYVIWCEEARIAWLRHRGILYRDLEASGTLMPVIDLRIGYKRSVRFDDELHMLTTSAVLGPTRMQFTTILKCEDQVCAEAQVTVAAIDRSGKPCRLPSSVRQQP